MKLTQKKNINKLKLTKWISIKSFKNNKHADKKKLQINEYITEMIILFFIIM